jgi:hypothetical protein
MLLRRRDHRTARFMIILRSAGINEAESKIYYIMEVYESVYKFDLR